MDHPAAGTFLGYGVDVPVALAPGSSTQVTDLPLPLLVAGWLREMTAPRVAIEAELVPPDLPTEDCRQLGAELAARLSARPDPVALLVVGDGAITHGEKAPGYLDRRAEPFDAAVASALAEADPGQLLALEAGLALELNAVGRAPWQVLAGAARAVGEHWHGELAYSAAPFGVAYHVALWRRA
jgi:aromatic ring-opening dioxygenase LigB subunit